jgi:hypothetical protein
VLNLVVLLQTLRFKGLITVLYVLIHCPWSDSLVQQTNATNVTNIALCTPEASHFINCSLILSRFLWTSRNTGVKLRKCPAAITWFDIWNWDYKIEVCIMVVELVTKQLSFNKRTFRFSQVSFIKPIKVLLSVRKYVYNAFIVDFPCSTLIITIHI